MIDWWDSVELWVTQLGFPLQVVLAVLVVLPLCWGAAGMLDRVVDAVAARWPGPRRRDRS